MRKNVGDAERYARLAVGALAAWAVGRSSGWQRAMYGTVAAAGLTTGLTQYCPINEAMGVDRYAGSVDWERNDEIRRRSATTSAMGVAPSTAGDTPAVTQANDVFQEEQPAF